MFSADSQVPSGHGALPWPRPLFFHPQEFLLLSLPPSLYWLSYFLHDFNVRDFSFHGDVSFHGQVVSLSSLFVFFPVCIFGSLSFFFFFGLGFCYDQVTPYLSLLVSD